MILHVLMGQRKERYPGEYGAEALACAFEHEYSDNPEYLNDQKQKYEASSEFTTLVIVDVKMDALQLDNILRPKAAQIEATVSARISHE